MPTAARRKVLESKRRSPQRANARETVSAIFEATARILQAEGRGGLNTNRIAERAGVSIGSLYAYFPHKEAILLAMARRELDALRERVADALLAGDEPDPVRRAVRALIEGYGQRGRARRILMETLFALGGTDEMARPVDDIAKLLATHHERLIPNGARPLSEVGLYVLTRAVDTVIRAATYERVGFLASGEFEDEMVRLVQGFLRPDVPAVTAAALPGPPPEVPWA